MEDSKNDELEGKVVKIPALIRKNHHQYKKYQLFTNLDKVWPFAKQWKAKSTKSFVGKLSSILVICSEYFQCEKKLECLLLAYCLIICSKHFHELRIFLTQIIHEKQNYCFRKHNAIWKLVIYLACIFLIWNVHVYEI